MRVAMIAAECEPWAKTGGLGDVVDALARALGRIARRTIGTVDVFLPRYRSVMVPPNAGPSRSTQVPDPAARGGTIEVRVRDVAADGYRLRLVEEAAAFDRDGIYGDGRGIFDDNAWRFSLLSRGALAALRADIARGEPPVDVIHLHDWHAAPAALHRDMTWPGDQTLGRAAILLTVHNLAFQGWTPADRVGELRLPADRLRELGDRWGVNLLAEAIERAELVNTVSPTYAVEGRTAELGMGLGGRLTALGDRFFGILNGLDPALWDPSVDPVIAAQYSRVRRAGKARCRADLIARTGLAEPLDGPLMGVIGRLDPQKGFDLVSAAAPRLLALGARLIVLGSGDDRLVEGIRAVGLDWPRRVAVFDRFDRELARRIYAGADLFLMPSRFEPSGQGQMIAMRYGTPPIVRRTGGLADSVVDVDERPAEGNGFVFAEATPGALARACERAIRCFRGGRGPASRWTGVVERAMAADFSWDSGPARRYIAAYDRAIQLRRAR